jgi:hypothetical protein
MKYRMHIYPAMEDSAHGITFTFETAEQMIVAKECCANLLLFVQDELKVMKDYSNSFELEEIIDGEWEEYEGFE